MYSLPADTRLGAYIQALPYKRTYCTQMNLHLASLIEYLKTAYTKTDWSYIPTSSIDIPWSIHSLAITFNAVITWKFSGSPFSYAEFVFVVTLCNYE